MKQVINYFAFFAQLNETPDAYVFKEQAMIVIFGENQFAWKWQRLQLCCPFFFLISSSFPKCPGELLISLNNS